MAKGKQENLYVNLFRGLTTASLAFWMRSGEIVLKADSPMPQVWLNRSMTPWMPVMQRLQNFKVGA